MKKVLITGASGFVGKHLIQALKESFIIGLDTSDGLEDSDHLKSFSVDIINREKFSQIIEKHLPEVIIHLAAKPLSSSKSYKENLETNLLGTLNLYEIVEEIKKSKDFDPKILYISSAEVYGNTDSPENIVESSLLNPVSPYGISKLAADRLSYQVSQYKRLNIVIVRPFNHTGPGQKKGFFVPDIASQIVEIEQGLLDEILVGNLEGVRDITDVRDIVEGYKLIIETDYAPGEVFNLCSGKGVKMKDLLDSLLSCSTQEIRVKKDPSRLRIIDIPVTIGNHDKFTQLTGWQPKIGMEQTLKETLDYWRNLL